MSEEIGKHKGAVETLLHEQKELSRILQIVNSQLERHVKALEEAGVDTDQFIKEFQEQTQRRQQQQRQAQQKSSQQQRSQRNQSSDRNRNSSDNRQQSSSSSSSSDDEKDMEDYFEDDDNETRDFSPR